MANPRTESPTAAQIAKAMERDELVMYYQPKVCLLSGTVVGAEALVRWNDPHSRVLSPSVFMPQAEAGGLLHDMTVRFLDDVVAACAQVRRCAPDLALSLNVAPNDLTSHTISSRINSYLNGGSIRAHELQIEITESVVMENFDVVLDELGELASMGIKVLMDDFGTGYSSIDRLSQMPFSALKLDKGVVRRMTTSSQNLNTVRSAVAMARELGMTSIAEGVESLEQYNILIATGCEEAQGFYISKPLPLSQFLDFVKEDPNFPSSQIGCIHQALFNVLRYRKSLVDIAVCSALGEGQVAPSITDFRLSGSDQGFSAAQWYYGIGQLLNYHESFCAVEAPLKKLSDAGSALQRELITDKPSRAHGDRLQLVDQYTTEIVAHLQRLESALLAELVD
jgi:EAL domain-containing protein (putative c-di-GMP-specific phosphodiesterase class I)